MLTCVGLHGVLADKRLRLAVLAHFWNESEQPERFAVFHKFMEVVSASSNAGAWREARFTLCCAARVAGPCLACDLAL